jgi:EmrB/QacA subfamily drug resistance transporter
VRSVTRIPDETERAAVPAASSRLGIVLRLAGIGLGFSVVPLDTAVNIGFPDITRSFGLELPMIQWVVICYVLANAGPMLAFGRIGDMWGHAGVFRLGLAWNTAAFLLCAAAPGFGWLLLFRVLQGIGAGLIISCAPALVTSLYPEARRAHALGVFTLMFALSSACGPLIGGVLVAHWGWPGVFWFRAPIALAGLALTWRLPPPRTLGADERFDLAGAVLLALGLATLLLGVNALPRLAAGDRIALLLLVAAAASLTGFVWWEARIARPIVEVRLFRNPIFAVVIGANTVMYLTTFAVMLFAPYFLDRFTKLPLWQAGLVLGSGFTAMAAASPAAGWVIARLSAARIAPLGALATGAGLFMVGGWRPDTIPIVLPLTLLVQGLGLAFFQVASIDIVMETLPATQRGVAGSLAMLSRTIGTVTGAAVLTIGFHAAQGAAAAAGAGDADAFLAAYRATFHVAGLSAALLAALVAWSGRARRNPGAGA